MDEVLELSLDDLPTALQTLEPNQADKNQQSQAVISATGFQLVDSMWPQQPLNVPAFEPATGYEDIDIPKLKKAMRTISPPQANCTSGASYAETRPIDATTRQKLLKLGLHNFHPARATRSRRSFAEKSPNAWRRSCARSCVRTTPSARTTILCGGSCMEVRARASRIPLIYFGMVYSRKCSDGNKVCSIRLSPFKP